MMSKITSIDAIHSSGRWHDRLWKSSSWRFSPLGLVLLLSALFLPNIASADIVTTTYDFAASVRNGNTTTEFSSETIKVGGVNCTYYTALGNVQNPGRFATQNTGMKLRQATSSSGTTYGLCQTGVGTNQYRTFVITDLYAGDVVTVNGSTTFSVTSGNATANGNTFTMTEKGALGISLAGTQWIYSITVQHDDSGAWGYDPAPEIYDLYWVPQNTTFSGSDAGFNLNGRPAQYLTNLSNGLSLNNRIAVSQSSNGLGQWFFGDHGLQVQWSWHNVSICNLVEGDRVVISYTGQATFSSAGLNGGYNGCAAYKDVENDGDFSQSQGDAYVTNGMNLDAKKTGHDNNLNADTYTTYAYTVTEDGHLDIGLAPGSRIIRIEIWGDHQANMVDKYNGQGQGSTSYFNKTGQLDAKHHIVPGGLHVYVGNDNLEQHAEVVMSNEGPVSFVYDENHFKTPNFANHRLDRLFYDLPIEGTFYRFKPDVDGTMTVRIKTHSINYHNWNIQGNQAYDQYNTPNEVTNNVECPYYLMPTEYQYQNKIEERMRNGETLKFEREVTAGATYYLFGWWDNTNQYTDFENHACGVAELIDVTFVPSKYIYPLAKWVESGATNVEAADISGYSDVCIKKKSDNIESCQVAIENGKLMVKNITYKSGTNPGGVILVKVGDRNNDADPVFALTIAYDAGFNMNEETGRTEGYVWNFSERPLNGLKWTNRESQEATVTPFGTRFNNYATAPKDDTYGIPQNGVNANSLLSEEINKGDWTFNYRVRKNGTFHDPRFLNNYDMEGDNADMMWDTQGIIINAGSTQSCIFDEFCLTDDRVIYHGDDPNVDKEVNNQFKSQADPDRYVGFLPGGSFILPKLKKDDRVVIYMGSGEGSGSESMEFHITNARDAVYNIIDPNDFYHVGGSMWNVPDGHNDPYYRGCYHFFAKADGDMVFNMTRGTMCKLYEIRIYRGTRYGTNGVQENGKGYTIFAEKDQNGTVTTSETNSWNLHYRGKGERIADGSGKFNQENEVLAHSGNITHCQNSDLVRLSNGQGIQYTNQGEIGMLRARVKCMDFNFNYVTDFADRNFTLALHETKSYPYTWDFTDIDLFSGSGEKAETDNILGEYENYNELEYDETNWYEPTGRELSMWDEEGKMVLYGPYSDDQATVYTNQNMIFENSKGINGNQLYANGDVIPETQGLWFYFDNNDPAYSGSTQITSEGLRLSNTKRTLASGGTTMGWWNTKMVVPDVPAGAAVYARVKRDPSVKVADYSQKPNEDPVYFLMNKYHFDWMPKDDKGSIIKQEIADGTNCRFYKADDAKTKTAYSPSDDPDEYIIAILNTGEKSHLTLTLNGWIIKKLSVSLDEKKLNKYGWATESRERVIDPELTAYLTGQPIKTFIPTSAGVDLNQKKVLLETVYPYTGNILDGKGTVMNAVITDGDQNACILYNTNNANTEILKGGFHLFVPDMHDDPSNENSEKIIHGVSESIMKAKLASGKVGMTEGSYTNYVLTYSTAKAGWDDETDPYDNFPNHWPGSDNPDAGYVGFFRVQPTGVTSNGHQGYIQFLTDDVRPDSNGSNFFSIVFGDEDTNAISNPTVGTSNAEPNYYNLWGQKLNGQPTQRGVYIVNGKKITVK